MPEKTEYKLLQNINYPPDLRKLKENQLKEVCDEIRRYLIEVLSQTPGHFASSLGAVELAVALHYVFNTPEDKIIWDVGHQAYAHKILTGRRESFKTLRQRGGISGFPNPSESEYDAYIAGHASVSISAGLGMSVASILEGYPDQKIVAVIGDGSMTGGLAFEGLNNASERPNNLLIILNDNHMAIDDPVGGMSHYLVDLTTSKAYNDIRYSVYRALKKKGIIKEEDKDRILRFNNSVKSLITKEHNLFEGLNIRYFGPIDGNNIDTLVKTLRQIKDMKGPRLLHVHTKKGKGYSPAEQEATIWHSPGKFNKDTGERIVSHNSDEPQLYQDVFGHTLVELAEQNKKIVGVTPAMPTGCSMTFLMKEMPERAFDVGIAEGHAVTFSAGMAKEGMLPFCNIYSTFMQRAYDEVIHDVAIQNLNMVLCLDRGGLVGEDGITHQGVFDMAYMRCIPNLTIASPLNEIDLRNLMYTASRPEMGPFVIRYPKGKGELKDWKKPFEFLPVGKGRKLKEGKEIAVISIGPIGNIAAKAIETAKISGIDAAHYDMLYLKPIDEELLSEIGKKFKTIVTVENGTIIGGLGSAVMEYMMEKGYGPKVKRIGVPDRFIPHGSISEQYKLCGMDADSICKVLIESHENNYSRSWRSRYAFIKNVGKGE